MDIDLNVDRNVRFEVTKMTITSTPHLQDYEAVRKISLAVQTNMSTVHRNSNKKLVVKQNPRIDDITAVEKQVVR